ncbi:MAG: YfbK domain-containing protein, partial [Verrucomicrobiota bacterium]
TLEGEHPFAFALENAACPWAEDHQLLRVGIQGRKMNRDQRPAANLVFLLDVSGSMKSANKLPLVKEAMSILVEELNQNDKVSIVVYAGAEGLSLPATSGDQQATILTSLKNLESGGSTNGGAGIELAYKVAAENYIEDGINRVLLCTDGDFNVGTTNQGALVDLVSDRAKTGTFLSVLGFGSGNINDAMLEAITNKGNGTYYYVDTIQEARKVFLQDIMATLVTIAKDVKIQIEFNPAQVQSYRLIGYANRMLKPEDFEDDRVDAGEIGAGHQVTALYEIIPNGVKAKGVNRKTPGLKYQREPQKEIVESPELATLKLRYKLPDEQVSFLMEQPVLPQQRDWKDASDDFQFASGLGLFGMLLRDSKHQGSGTLADVLELANEGKGNDPHGRRAEFIELAREHAKRQ